MHKLIKTFKVRENICVRQRSFHFGQ